ncbi:hypothetical protein DW081_15415 [Clostridium sp. AF46-9NS]|nr:hypothetical protein DW081_15415 [Clostridium sp. AF46-9NS]RGF35336.1 hypothetical protein DW076_10060 [Clostridium sp. AF46-12NS]RHT18907.1 hypothetical protein DW835_09930 [Clostridium sp. AM34-9AC]RHU63905.1 hypothetical protein DXC82_08145 [Clostridium sp. TF08-15]
MSGSKAPDFDAYGLLRATHSHVSAPLRSVLDMCHWHIAPWHHHYVAHKQKKLRTIFQYATSYYTTRFLLSQSAFSTI